MKLSLPLPAYRATPTPPPLPQPRPRTICGCHSLESATQKIFLSPPSSVLAVFSVFHCCDLAVVPCSCHSLLHAATVGELLAVHTCNQIAAPPDLRLACGLGNFIVPSRTRRTRRTNTKSAAKQFNDSGVLHLKHAWSARCGGLDKLVNTF